MDKKILILSYSNIDYDGRLKALVSVFKEIGKVSLVAQSNDGNSCVQYVYKPSRFIPYLDFIHYCCKIAKNYGKIDILVADNRKSILPAMLIKAIFNPKFVIHDSREMYLLSDKRGFSSKIGCLIEKIFNKSFDIIIAANEFRARYMYHYYGLTKMPVVFENIRALPSVSDEKEKVYDQKWQDILSLHNWRLVSTDGCDLSRDILGVVKAVGKYGNNAGLYIIGNNTNRHDVDEFCAKNNINNIHVLGRMSQDELHYFIKNCHIGIVRYPKDTLNDLYCASGKVYEFLFAGILVLMSENPPLMQLSKCYKFGICSDNILKGLSNLIDNFEIYKRNSNHNFEDICYESVNKNFVSKIRKECIKI